MTVSTDQLPLPHLKVMINLHHWSNANEWKTQSKEQFPNQKSSQNQVPSHPTIRYFPTSPSMAVSTNQLPPLKVMINLQNWTSTNEWKTQSKVNIKIKNLPGIRFIFPQSKNHSTEDHNPFKLSLCTSRTPLKLIITLISEVISLKKISRSSLLINDNIFEQLLYF